MVGGGGGGGGGGDQNLLSVAYPLAHQRMELSGQWGAQMHSGVEHGLQHQLQHQLQQQQQQQLQQQQLNMMLGQHGGLAPLVGQQISQLSSMLPVGSQHQSPPTLNMMLGGHVPGA